MKNFIEKIIVFILICSIALQGAQAAVTPNKLYNNQSTGSNVNTWGIVLNSNFTTIDSNLGGTLTLSVAGNSNITLSPAQAANLIYNFTGVLTGNIKVIYPAAGGLYFINNQTIGAFTLTAAAGTSTQNVLIPQGQSVPIVVDNSVSPPVVYGAIGTQYVYSTVSVGGTANALIVSSTTPSNFTLNVGDMLFFTPTASNTTSATLTTPDGSTNTIQKETFAGLANLQADDLQNGLPVIAYWNGSNWIGLNIIPVGPAYQSTVSTPQSIGFAQLGMSYVNTTAVNYTITNTTNLLPYWYMNINALGGIATITPDGSDSINVNGATLVAGTAYGIPAGASATITTDAAGNLFITSIIAPPNILQSNPSSPNSTSSTSGVMSGLGVTFTPKSTGDIRIRISGDMSNNSNGDGSQAQIRYGTGSAPANGDALTGTLIGAVIRSQNPVGVNSVVFPFPCDADIAGLTIGTTYWIDLSQYALTGGTASLSNINVSIEEIK